MASIESLQDAFRPKGIYDIVRIKEGSTRPRLRLPQIGDSPEDACDKLVAIHEAMKTRASLALNCQSITLEDYLNPLSPHERLLLTTNDDMQYLQYTKWHAGADPPPLDTTLLTVCYISTHQLYNAEALNRMYRTTDFTLRDVECFLLQLPFLFPLFVALRKLIALEADVCMNRNSLTGWQSGIKTVISRELEATIDVIQRARAVFPQAGNEEREIINQVLKALYERKAKLKTCMGLVTDGPPIGEPWPSLPNVKAHLVVTNDSAARSIPTESHSPNASSATSGDRMVEISSPYNSDEDEWPGIDSARIRIRGGNFARRSGRAGRDRPRTHASSRGARSRPARTSSSRPVSFVPRQVVNTTGTPVNSNSTPSTPEVNTTADWNTFASHPDKNKLKMENGMMQFHTPGARMSATQAGVFVASQGETKAAQPATSTVEMAARTSSPMPEMKMWKNTHQIEQEEQEDHEMDLLGDNGLSMNIPIMHPNAL